MKLLTASFGAGIGLLLLTGSAPPRPATLCRAGETSVFSFVTKGGKTACLCEGPKQAYLAYRFGTATQVELQYPAVLDRSSWKKFTYAFYLRGGGISNAGLDINELRFTNGGVKYRLYQNYSAEQEEDKGNDVGIEAIVNGKATQIGARVGTVKGNIIGFRDNTKVTKGELE
ncbi:hypothetical protein [Hymenobacter negativus]|uniref:Uncharacterized protein n=1 Tax=Hymenobacter negativus TaxID=2795026 RepID=A0ABS3QGM6_9BACT|nr:hypothetical protein [Hymenobacter negativus]MBO2010312.1 hypothetical protein [Hymenobacter negativus]